MVKDLGVILPFQIFEANVLRALGMALSQLHPNGWAAMQAFKLVYRALYPYNPTFPLPLHYSGWKESLLVLIHLCGTPIPSGLEQQPGEKGNLGVGPV
ncbi:hypothetical protein CR513_42241, partial [Mucuna pruriens]